MARGRTVLLRVHGPRPTFESVVATEPITQQGDPALVAAHAEGARVETARCFERRQEPRVLGGEDAINLSTVAISGNCPMSSADQLIDHAGQAVVHPLRLVQLDDLQNVRRGEEFDAAVLGPIPCHASPVS